MEPAIKIITLQQSELSQMLFDAAKMGAEQAIKAISPQASQQNDESLWDMQDCANHLNESYKQFRDITSKARNFPKPAKLNPNASRRDSWRWRPQDIKAWAKAR